MTKKLNILILFFLIILTGCSTTNPKENGEYKRYCFETFDYFTTYSTVCVWANEEFTLTQERKIDNIMQSIENTFSRTSSDSELYKVNSEAGKSAVEVSDELFNIIKKSIEYAEASNGKFDPTIGALVDLWDIDPERGSEFRPPITEKIQDAGALLGYNKVVLNEQDKSVYLPDEGMVLDLGGIAKGYAADKIKAYLVDEGFKHAIINLGGNVLTIGDRYTKTEGWRIGIQDPEANRGSGQFAILEVSDQTIVTSGIYERYNWYEDRRYHHIIDTETFEPVQNDLYCVTIVTDSSADADALSTSTFALGVIEGLELVESMDGVEAIFVTKDYKIIVSSGLVNSDKFTITEDYEDQYKIISLEEYKNL